ncbi:hypothetical protein Tco_0266057 [Tanacetum coccineum]
MPPKRTSTSEAPSMTQAAIKKLVANSVSAALEAQAANMANTDNTTRPREALCKKVTTKSSIAGGPIPYQSTQRCGKAACCLICWFDAPNQCFSHSELYRNCTGEVCSTRLTLTDRSSILVQKMEDEFYHLTVKGNDLKTCVRRFQELATLCPTMVPDSEKMMEVFIRGLPQSIEGNVPPLNLKL